MTPLQLFVIRAGELGGIGDKTQILEILKSEFQLTEDRSVYYSETFAVRFCYSASGSFSNTVLSLSNLQKYDHIPFLICLITKSKNQLFLANSTFLAKISHSSKELRADNIKGSFNGSDILKQFVGKNNSPENFDFLYGCHREMTFSENLLRLVESTNNIAATGTRFCVAKPDVIFESPTRAKEFVESRYFLDLKQYLDSQVEKFRDEILIAAFIDNTNIRGRIIEYLISGEDDGLRSELIAALQKEGSSIPRFQTKNDLGDYEKIFDRYKTATDIKTKIMILHSNPKAYNLDKMLRFLSTEGSVFMFYFVGIEPNKIIGQSLVSIFQRDLLRATLVQSHWAGRNSRGVAQFNGEVIKTLIGVEDNRIDIELSREVLKQFIEL